MAVALLAGACSGDDGDTATSDADPDATITEPSSGDWPQPNLDLSGTRAVFDSPIDSSTVDGLEVAWTYPIVADSPVAGAAATTPVIVDGTVYLNDLETNVYAIDLESGEEKWTVEIGVGVFGPSGLAFGDGRIYADRDGSSLAAYDAGTGEELWSTSLTDEFGGRVLIPPVFYDGRVFSATTSLVEPGAEGVLTALDAETGEQLWVFDTLETDDLWGHPELNSGGGSWQAPAVDPEAGLVYYGIANPWPSPGSPEFPNGSSRPGDNKYTDSIVALDIETGELVWYDQAVEHDIFDRDSIITAIATVDGEDGPEEVVIHTGKLGRVRGFTPEGEKLWDTPIGIHRNDELTEFEGPLEVMPGNTGGVVTPIATADGAVYVSVMNAPTFLAGPAMLEVGGNNEFGQHNAQFLAVDALTGEILWDVELDGDAVGGATVVNDLVFTSNLGGQITAHDRATGEVVWSHQAPGGINGWIAVVGDRLIVPVGLGPEPVLYALQLG